MDLVQLKAEKDRLQQNIEKLIYKFVKETGVDVKNVRCSFVRLKTDTEEENYKIRDITIELNI